MIVRELADSGGMHKNIVTYFDKTGALGSPMAFAGLWERWRDPANGETVKSFAIITGEPNARCEPIHNRMPVILDPADFPAWLGGVCQLDHTGRINPPCSVQLRCRVRCLTPCGESFASELPMIGG
jgi:putative SOS response-associated peptidase YedK